MAQLNSGYSSSQVMEMQRDAMERVREMQRRAQQNLRQSNGQIPQAAPPLRRPPEFSHQSSSVPAAPAAKSRTPPRDPTVQSRSPYGSGASFAGPSGFLGGILDTLHLDEERIFLLVLIFLLLREGTDNLLILALLYLII